MYNVVSAVCCEECWEYHGIIQCMESGHTGWSLNDAVNPDCCKIWNLDVMLKKLEVEVFELLTYWTDMWQVNSECYTGWLDYWNGGHAHGDTNMLLKTLEAAREIGASISMYAKRWLSTLMALIAVHSDILLQKRNSVSVIIHLWTDKI